MRAASHVNRGIDYSKQGQYDKAISEFNKAIETKPRYTLAYYNRGNAYSNRDQYEKVISDYTKATEINPRYAKPYNNLAWILATCPDAEYREGAKAVELAQKAVELKPKAFCLDTLAAAYAEAGRFEDAITVQEKAIALLRKEEGKTEILAGYMERLNSYKANKPWRERHVDLHLDEEKITSVPFKVREEGTVSPPVITWKCEKCGAEISAEFLDCPNCGEPRG
jgi:tetratricopeptide (TPR) repeat protein